MFSPYEREKYAKRKEQMEIEADEEYLAFIEDDYSYPPSVKKCDKPQEKN